MNIPLGLSREDSVRVAEHLVTDRGFGVRVLSTPSLIQIIERSAHEAIVPYLPEGSITVGYKISLTHLAPTPEGQEIRVRVVVKEVQGRRIVFEVEAWDPVDKVAEGVHERYVLDGERYRERLENKMRLLHERAGKPAGADPR